MYTITTVLVFFIWQNIENLGPPPFLAIPGAISELAHRKELKQLKHELTERVKQEETISKAQMETLKKQWRNVWSGTQDERHAAWETSLSLKC